MRKLLIPGPGNPSPPTCACIGDATTVTSGVSNMKGQALREATVPCRTQMVNKSYRHGGVRGC